jgi:hypothetical protein
MLGVWYNEITLRLLRKNLSLILNTSIRLVCRTENLRDKGGQSYPPPTIKSRPLKNKLPMDGGLRREICIVIILL